MSSSGRRSSFVTSFSEPLLNVLEKALKPGGVVYLAHDIKRRSLEPF